MTLFLTKSSSLKMAFCYALVSRGNIPLCQHCAVPGNFDLYYQKFLPNGEKSDSITIHKVDGYIWGVKNDIDDLNVLCVVRDDCEKSVIVKILNEIQSRFIKMYQDEWRKASTFSLQASFEPNLIDISRIIQQQQPIILTEIVPPSMNDIESSDADEYLLLNPKNTARPDIRKRYRKNRNITANVLLICVLIFFVIFIIYIIATFFCGGWSLSTCF